jgi:O-antigen/teichoic acid export membrane protein
MIGQDDIIFSGKVDAVIKVNVLIFCILLFYIDLLSITSSIILLFLEYLVYTTIGIFKLKIKKLDFKMDFIFLKTLFNFNTKSYVFGIFFFILLRGDQYIVKYFLGNFQTGIYTQSGVITEQLQILSAIAATMFIPKFLKEKDFRVVIQKTNKLLLFVLVLNLIIGLVFYFMAPWVIEVYFKNKNQNHQF